MDSQVSEIEKIMAKLTDLPTLWEAKPCILELKEANFNWKQMEWPGFYFEFKVRERLKHFFDIPGDKYKRVMFDLKSDFNWDIKTHAIKSASRKGTVILNDVTAMEKSIENHGYHGEIIGLYKAEYNDEDRSFQKWHTELKGGLSKYEKMRKKRTSVSRLRKTSAVLLEIFYIVLTDNDLSQLGIMNQGRNSNGKPRPKKYTINLENIDGYNHQIQQFNVL